MTAPDQKFVAPPRQDVERGVVRLAEELGRLIGQHLAKVEAQARVTHRDDSRSPKRADNAGNSPDGS